MKNYALPSFFLLVLAAGATLACGTSSSPRLLQSVTVSPATADALNYPNGQVQFTATGFYSREPSPVTPLSGTWGACYQGASTAGVTVNQNGVAQCAVGAAGVYTVFAEDYPYQGGGCLATTACGGGCWVAGTAQLTCP